MKKVYLAGPITGSSFDSVTSWRDKLVEVFKRCGVEALTPMRAKDYLLKEKEIKDNYDEYFLSTITAINIRDYNDATTSDALFVNLLGSTKVSIGTVMEVAWARAYNVPVVIVIEPTNIHQHGMLLYHAIVVDNLQDGVHAVKTILNV